MASSDLKNVNLDDAFNSAIALLGPESFVIADLHKYADEVMFEGFDPKRMFYILQSKCVKAVKTSFAKDMAYLIVLYVERGTKIQKILNSSSKEAQDAIGKLAKLYEIKEGAGKRGHQVVTLSRIAQVFPWMTCDYSAKARSPTVPFEKMESISKGYPRVMMCSAFPAMIPNDVEKDKITELVYAYLLYQMEFHKIISNQTYSHENSLRFAQAAVNSTYVPNQDRRKWCLDNKLMSTGLVIDGSVTSAAALYKSKIGKN